MPDATTRPCALAPPGARCAGAGLHLVHDEGGACVRADALQAAEERSGRVVVAALALDRLHDHARHRRGGAARLDGGGHLAARAAGEWRPSAWLAPPRRPSSRSLRRRSEAHAPPAGSAPLPSRSRRRRHRAGTCGGAGRAVGTGDCRRGRQSPARSRADTHLSLGKGAVGQSNAGMSTLWMGLDRVAERQPVARSVGGRHTRGRGRTHP